MMKVTRSSGAMSMKAFIRAPAGVGSSARARPNSIPIRRPPDMARPALTTSRRVRDRTLWFGLRSGSTLDALPYPHIGAATADIPRHGGIDVCIVGLWIVCQQSCGRHDLSRLAVSTLNDFQIEPGLLDFGAGGGLTHSLNRRDGPIPDRTHR